MKPVVEESTSRQHAATNSAATHIDRISTILLVGFLAALAQHYWLAQYEGLGYPNSTYLFRPGDEFGVTSKVTRLHAFGDLLAPYLHAQERDPYFTTLKGNLNFPFDFPSNYPPFATILMWPLTALPYTWVTWLFLTLSTAAFLQFGGAAFPGDTRASTMRNAVTFTLLTYPVQLVLDRGNLEVVSFFLTSLFISEHQRGRTGRAILFLGSAIALKIFPIVFLAVYLRPLRLKQITQTLAIAVSLTVLSFMLLKRPIVENAIRFAEVLTSYSANQVSEGILGARLNPSMSAMLDVVAALTSGELSHLAFTLSKLPLALGIGATFLWTCVRKPLPLWSVLVLSTAAMTLLPRTAADYRLIYWLIPLAAFVRDAGSTRAHRAMGVLFAILLMPKGMVLAGEVRLGTVLNPSIMLFITSLVVLHRVDPIEAAD
jgi:hypothetical protein